MKLTITRTLAVAELGIIAFLREERIALVVGARHRVAISRPDGKMLEVDATVERVRNDVSGDEFTALLFESIDLREVVPGSTVVVLEELRGA